MSYAELIVEAAALAGLKPWIGASGGTVGGISGSMKRYKIEMPENPCGPWLRLFRNARRWLG